MIFGMKRKPLGFWLIMALLVVCFTFLLLFSRFHVPLSTLHRFATAVMLVLICLLLRDRKTLQNHRPQVKWLLVGAGAYFLSTLAGQLLHFQPVYYLSGLSNSLRFFVFFFACVLYLEEADRDTILRGLDGLFWLNFAVSMYQFLVLGIKWDYLGGIFGVGIGVSSSSNNLLTVAVASSMIRYLNQRQNALTCLLTCAAALIIAALAELRMFILMFAVIAVMAFLLTKFSRRKIYLLIGAAVGVAAGALLLSFVFPNWSGWFKLSSILRYSSNASGYMGIGDFNRINAIPNVWNGFLNSGGEKLFGLGLGNCDVGFTGELTPAFYFENYHLNYTLFTACFVLLETGLVGFVLYIGFFALVALAAFHLEHRGDGDPVYCQTSIILAAYTLVLFVYDASIRTECAYLIYFVLALPFLKSAKETVK